MYGFVFGLLGIVLCSTSKAASATPQSGVTPAPSRASARNLSAGAVAADDLTSLELRALSDINAERNRHGLPSLAVSPELSRLAREFSRDMVERRFFDHLDPDGNIVSNRAERAGIGPWKSIAENIARNRGFDDPAAVAVREWMKSDGHRENILDRGYKETGLGAWVAPDRTVYFTQIFMTRNVR